MGRPGDRDRGEEDKVVQRHVGRKEMGLYGVRNGGIKRDMWGTGGSCRGYALPSIERKHDGNDIPFMKGGFKIGY